VDWIKHFINFKHKRHQSNMGAAEVMAKAKSAILCLCRVRSNLVCTYFSDRAVMPV